MRTINLIVLFAAVALSAFSQELTINWQYNCTHCSVTMPDFASLSQARIPQILSVDEVSTHPRFANPSLAATASQLNSLKEKLVITRQEIPQFIKSFVQNLPPALDAFTDSSSSDYQHPVYTLSLGIRSSRDAALLEAVLLQLLGFDTLILHYPTHSAIALDISPAQGRAFWFQGKNYFYLEPLAAGWNIGQVPLTSDSENPQIVPLACRQKKKFFPNIASF